MTAPVHGGARSLRLSYAGSSTVQVEIDQVFCGGGGTNGNANRQGKTLSAWIYFDVAIPLNSSVTLGARNSTPGSTGAGATTSNPPAGSWFNIVVPTNAGFDVAYSLYVIISLNAPWTGSMYLDDVTWR